MPDRARSRLLLSRVVVVVALAAAGVLGLFADSASAAVLHRPETRVAAIGLQTTSRVGAHDQALPDQRRARAPDTATTASGSCVAAEGGLDDTTAALQEHLSAAVDRFNTEGLTEAQEEALIDNPGLKAAFEGQRIDSLAPGTGVLVHNDDGSAGTSCDPLNGPVEPNRMPIDPQRQAGHVQGTPQYLNRLKVGKAASVWNSEIDENPYTQYAWEYGNPTSNPNLRTFDFQDPVGTGAYGGTQTQVTVSRNPTTGRIHGYPSGPIKW
jgi:hypothetical protein